MTIFTAIADANLDPDSPARSIDALALRDNAIAVAEMDITAPRPVCAAGTTTCWKLPLQSVVPVSSYELTGVFDSPSSSIGARVFATGTIRMELEHYIDVSGTSFVRVLKNEALVQEWSTTSSTPVARSVDFSVVFGDTVQFQAYYTGGGAGYWLNKTIEADKKILINSAVSA